jgi:hypothetical protein
MKRLPCFEPAGTLPRPIIVAMGSDPNAIPTSQMERADAYDHFFWNRHDARPRRRRLMGHNGRLAGSAATSRRHNHPPPAHDECQGSPDSTVRRDLEKNAQPGFVPGSETPIRSRRSRFTHLTGRPLRWAQFSSAPLSETLPGICFEIHVPRTHVPPYRAQSLQAAAPTSINISVPGRKHLPRGILIQQQSPRRISPFAILPLHTRSNGHTSG